MPKRPTNTTVTITVDGDHSFTFRSGDITARIARQVRQATGMSLMKAMRLLGEEPDLDVLAAVCYAGALQTNPSYPFDEIEQLITYDADYDASIDDVEEGDDPEE